MNIYFCLSIFINISNQYIIRCKQYDKSCDILTAQSKRKVDLAQFVSKEAPPVRLLLLVAWGVFAR